MADAWQGGLAWSDAPIYIAAQILGAFAGVDVAHLMFGEPLFFASHKVRAGAAQMFGEFVATFGLLAVIWGVFAAQVRRCALCGSGVYHGGLLVHGFDFIRKPRSYARARGERHLCRHQTN
jgi:glycerol uptake facilitator-like aquaporin